GTGAPQTRFDTARRLALSVLDQARNGSDVTLIRAGASPEVLAPGGDGQAVRSGLNGMPAGAAPADIKGALLLAANLANQSPGEANQVVVFSDGAYPSVAGMADLAVPMRFVQVGNGDANQGVTAVS